MICSWCCWRASPCPILFRFSCPYCWRASPYPILFRFSCPYCWGRYHHSSITICCWHYCYFADQGKFICWCCIHFGPEASMGVRQPRTELWLKWSISLCSYRKGRSRCLVQQGLMAQNTMNTLSHSIIKYWSKFISYCVNLISTTLAKILWRIPNYFSCLFDIKHSLRFLSKLF